MRVKRISAARVISLMIHAIIGLILSIYIVSQTTPFKDLMGAEVFSSREPLQPKVRKPVVKIVIVPYSVSNETVFRLKLAAIFASEKWILRESANYRQATTSPVRQIARTKKGR